MDWGIQDWSFTEVAVNLISTPVLKVRVRPVLLESVVENSLFQVLSSPHPSTV
jgi:hypothetical protein